VSPATERPQIKGLAIRLVLVAHGSRICESSFPLRFAPPMSCQRCRSLGISGSKYLAEKSFHPCDLERLFTVVVNAMI
jgi:hypothetical protein